MDRSNEGPEHEVREASRCRPRNHSPKVPTGVGRRVTDGTRRLVPPASGPPTGTTSDRQRRPAASWSPSSRPDAAARRRQPTIPATSPSAASRRSPIALTGDDCRHRACSATAGAGLADLDGPRHAPPTAAAAPRRRPRCLTSAGTGSARPASLLARRRQSSARAAAGDPAEPPRAAWLRRQRRRVRADARRRSTTLELVNDQQLADSRRPRRPVPPATSAAWPPRLGSMVTVGVASGTVRASPTSRPRSLKAHRRLPGRRSSPRPGLARGRPRPTSAARVDGRHQRDSPTSSIGWTRLSVAGLRPAAAGPAACARPGRRHRPPRSSRPTSSTSRGAQRRGVHRRWSTR